VSFKNELKTRIFKLSCTQRKSSAAAAAGSLTVCLLLATAANEPLSLSVREEGEEGERQPRAEVGAGEALRVRRAERSQLACLSCLYQLRRERRRGRRRERGREHRTEKSGPAATKSRRGKQNTSQRTRIPCQKGSSASPFPCFICDGVFIERKVPGTTEEERESASGRSPFILLFFVVKS